MIGDEAQSKFEKLTSKFVRKEQIRQIIDIVNNLERVEDISKPMGFLVVRATL